MSNEAFMRRALALAEEGMNANAGGPFGAVIVKDGRILAEGYNHVTSTNDPTAHAEVVDFRFVDGGAGAMTRGDMLLHVVNHKTYHRGYVADMLYQAGSRPPVMDLPVFLRDVPQHHDARS